MIYGIFDIFNRKLSRIHKKTCCRFFCNGANAMKFGTVVFDIVIQKNMNFILIKNL